MTRVRWRHTTIAGHPAARCSAVDAAMPRHVHSTPSMTLATNMRRAIALQSPERPDLRAGRWPCRSSSLCYVLAGRVLDALGRAGHLRGREPSPTSFDGYLARAWQQQSDTRPHARPDRRQAAGGGDPADAGRPTAPSPAGRIWAAIVILSREILVSGLREYLAELRVSVPVTHLAKWKTTLQLVAIGFLHRRAGGRACPARHRHDRPRPAVDLRAADALHGLRLFPRRHAPHRRRADVESAMKLVYFAWVRERIGKADEELALPAEVDDRRRSRSLAGRARRGVCATPSRIPGRPRRDRPQARQAETPRSPAHARSPSSRP